MKKCLLVLLLIVLCACSKKKDPSVFDEKESLFLKEKHNVYIIAHLDKDDIEENIRIYQDELHCQLISCDEDQACVFEFEVNDDSEIAGLISLSEALDFVSSAERTELSEQSERK